MHLDADRRVLNRKTEQAGPEKDKDKDQGDFLDLLAKHALQEAGENRMK